MKLTIQIDLDNAAFTDNGLLEVERLLMGLMDRLPDPLTETNGKLNFHDENGNHCGTAEIK